MSVFWFFFCYTYMGKDFTFYFSSVKSKIQTKLGSYRFLILQKKFWKYFSQVFCRYWRKNDEGGVCD